MGPLHRVCCAAPSVFCVWWRTAWCCALHCTVGAVPHCTCGQWAVGSGQWKLCYALPHCLGAVSSATPAMHCLTACRQWAVELLLCTAALSGGCGQWNSCNTLPHCLGAVGSGTAAMRGPISWGRGVLPRRLSLPKERNSRNALPHCLGAVGSGTPAVQCHTAWGRWAVELRQCASPPARGTGSPAQEAVAALRPELLKCTATLPGGSGQCNPCNAPLHCLGAMGRATPAIHCLSAWGQWAVELLSSTATLPRGSGQWNFCNALPYCLGAMGSATPAILCLTA